MFLNEKFGILVKILLKIVPDGSFGKKVCIGSGGGLALNNW